MHTSHADLLTEAVEESLALVAPSKQVAWIEVVAHEYEAAKRGAEVSSEDGRTTGTWYTPASVVESVLDRAFAEQGAAAKRSPSGERFRACDPSCGTGNFLVGIAERLLADEHPPRSVSEMVHGMDLDPMAVAIARVRLRLHCKGSSASGWKKAIRCGDALLAGAWDGDRFSMVAGNPPFLSQLDSASARTSAERQALLARFSGSVARYTDTAAVFMLLGTELAPCGVVLLLQPVSTLSAADSLPVRVACEARMQLQSVMILERDAFGAAVRTCVPVLVCMSDVRDHGVPKANASTGAHGKCSRVVEVITANHAPLSVPAARAAGGAWGAVLAASQGIPDPMIGNAAGTLDDWMNATADFRQHYYGLRNRVHAALNGRHSPDSLALVTVGALGAARLDWGKKPVKIHGKLVTSPVVMRKELESDPVLGPWLAARDTPKILVATQTRALEAWVDEDAVALPSTPAITVTPRKKQDLWRVAAALLAPSTSAEAWWRHAGAGMAVQAIRVSATQLRKLPAPGNLEAWEQGALMLQIWQRTQHTDDRDRFAAAMCDAYGVPAGTGRDELLNWWRLAIEVGARRRPRVIRERKEPAI